MKEEENLVEDTHSPTTTTGHKCIQPSQCRIDGDMVATKITYLLWGGLVATYAIYLNPFYVSIGIPKHKAGVITGIPYAVSALAAPLWGLLTDYTGRQRLILVVLCLCSAVWVGSLPLVANVVAVRSPATVNGKTNGNMSRNATSAFSNGSQDEVIQSSRGDDEFQDVITNGETMFYTFFVVMALGAVFFSCIGGYIEAIALKTIKASPRGATYGGQRICGSIGACVMTYLTGVLLDNVSITPLSPFAILFFVYPIFPLLLIPMVFILLHQYDKWTAVDTTTGDVTGSDGPESPIEEKRSIMSELLSLFSQLDVIVFMMTALVAGLSFCLIFFKMFLLTEQLEGVSKTEISVAFSMASLSNILMFPFTSRFIKFMHGPIPTIILGLFCYSLRHLVMSYTTSYWVMLGAQFTHCLTFATVWSSFMEHAHHISPPSIKTTVIVIVQSVHFGCGAFLCNTVGGVLYGMYDAKTLFRGNALMCGCWGGLLILYYGVRYRSGRKENVLVVEKGCSGDVSQPLCDDRPPGPKNVSVSMESLGVGGGKIIECVD